MSTAVSMRSYDIARTGVNIEEKVLTPQRVGSNLLRKLFSVVFDDDPRLEAQPLYVPNGRWQATRRPVRLHDGEQCLGIRRQ
jgi:hypothetical protein